MEKSKKSKKVTFTFDAASLDTLENMAESQGLTEVLATGQPKSIWIPDSKLIECCPHCGKPISLRRQP